MKMSRVLAVCVSVCAFAWPCYAEDEPQPEGLERNFEVGKIRVDVGFQAEGGLGLVATGEDKGYLERWSTTLSEVQETQWDGGWNLRRAVSYGLGLDASLSTADDRNSNIDAHFKFKLGWLHTRRTAMGRPAPVRPAPGMVRVAPPPAGTPLPNNDRVTYEHRYSDLYLLAPFVDLRYRDSTVAEGDSMAARVSQQVVGAGFEFMVLSPEWLGSGLANLYPRLIVRYYSVVNDSTDKPQSVAVPEGLTADHLSGQFRMQSRLPFNNLVGETSILLDLEVGYSEPLNVSSATEGGWQRTIKLLFESETFDGGITPAIIYKSGLDDGLEIDRQLLLSVGMQLWN